MDRRRGGTVKRSGWHIVQIGTALMAAPALGQGLLPVPTRLERVSGPVVHALLLDGDRLAGGVVEAFGRSQVSRRGEVGFVARLAQDGRSRVGLFQWVNGRITPVAQEGQDTGAGPLLVLHSFGEDRKSTRLNSSHPSISYAVFCLK